MKLLIWIIATLLAAGLITALGGLDNVGTIPSVGW